MTHPHLSVIQIRCLSLILGTSLLEEGADAFEVVGTFIDFGAVGIDTLEALGGNDGGCTAEDAELTLDGADGHDAVASQRCEEMLFEEAVQLVGGGHMVDEADVEGVEGCDGGAEEEHLTCLVHA